MRKNTCFSQISHSLSATIHFCVRFSLNVDFALGFGSKNCGKVINEPIFIKTFLWLNVGVQVLWSEFEKHMKVKHFTRVLFSNKIHYSPIQWLLHTKISLKNRIEFLIFHKVNEFITTLKNKIDFNSVWKEQNWRIKKTGFPTEMRL